MENFMNIHRSELVKLTHHRRGLEINNEKFSVAMTATKKSSPRRHLGHCDGDEFFEFGASLKRIFYGCAEQQEEAINRRPEEYQ
jgi:hypothetical protein